MADLSLFELSPKSRLQICLHNAKIENVDMILISRIGQGSIHTYIYIYIYIVGQQSFI